MMAGVFLIVAGVVRLGFIADFFSRTVLIGFLTGVGFEVAMGEISGMLGLPEGKGDSGRKLLADQQQLGQVNPYALGTSVGCWESLLGPGE